MDNELDKLSYSLGIDIAKSLLSQGVNELNGIIFGQAMNDIFSNSTLKMSEKDAMDFLNDHFSKLQAKQHEGVLKAGQDFLTANSKNEGVITLESGLQYQVLAEGEGEKPTADSTVTTHYHGTTVDGKVFDSSVERGTPASFPVKGVIAGWTEALQLMPVGSKWRLTVPSNLAYGDRGAGPDIGPHATLIFDVELLKINE
ncbi:MAG: FKBP-type peptidyl-prolyl cis-trans isomerase FklB [Saprospiraceae bacterium]|jgi:FKBP-type peptidyl-prolyl cis-trans isomerase FklB|tara:strand:- start:3926 stop:4525 length:600 start_codon:yes stop_codon:yes gene_type:complete